MAVTKYQLLLDLDEVLADFVGGVARAFAVRRGDLEAAWEPGEWGVHHALGRVLGIDLEEPEFWGMLRARGGPDFWLRLEPLPWVREVQAVVRDWCKAGGHELFMVTSPSDCNGCLRDKRRWVEVYLKDFLPPHRLVFCTHKAMMATAEGARRLLVDDNGETTMLFRDMGGLAVTFPRLHNHLHDKKDDPVGWLAKSLDYLTKYGVTP